MHTPEPITGTILLIDRDEVIAAQRSILEDAGFTVITATTTKDGLKVAREQHPDLVVSEVMLEKPDAGFVLAYRMKKDAMLAETPLVLMGNVFKNTGILFDLNVPEEQQWIKADAYMDRPVPPERFIAKVRGLIAHKRGLVA